MKMDWLILEKPVYDMMFVKISVFQILDKFLCVVFFDNLNIYSLWVWILAHFWKSRRRVFDTTVISLINENVLKQFYINIIVVVILYISLFGDFILQIINVYSMVCALSSVFFIWIYNVPMIFINLFTNFFNSTLMLRWEETGGAVNPQAIGIVVSLSRQLIHHSSVLQVAQLFCNKWCFPR